MAVRIEFLPADVLGPGPLVRAALAGKLAPGVVRSVAELGPPPVERDPLALEERAELAARLEAGASALEPPIAVLEGLRRLADPRASIVLARRPARLLAGPLATLHAGAAAARLARELTARWERPVTAVLALDDTPAERPEAWVLGRHYDLLRVSLEGLEGEPWPARVPLSSGRHGLGALRAALAQLHGDRRHLAEALDASVPREGESLVRAAARALAGLLGAQGLVPLDPAWLRPDLARALGRLAEVDRALDPPAGFQGGEGERLAVAAAPAALFAGPRGREELRAAGEGFASPTRPGSRTPAELAAAAVQEPGDWAPGPRWLGASLELALPLAVHLLEPDQLALDLARPAQLAALGLPARPAALRAGVSLVEPEVRVTLERSGLGVGDVLKSGVAPKEPQVDARGMSPGGQAAAARLREAARVARVGLLGPKAELEAVDPGLAGQLARLVRNLSGELERLAKKAERARANQLGQDRRRARRLEASLFPEGEPQEQRLAAFGLLARHGAGWLEALADLEALGAEHVVLQLEGPDPAPAG